MTDEEGYQALFDWLQSNGPREWHQVATSWNWDAGYEVLNWLIEQKTLDRGTAVSLFFLASPDYFLKYPNRDAMMADSPWAHENFDFIAKLVENAAKPDFYVDEAFSSDEIATQGLVDDYVSQQNNLPAESRPWTVPDKLLSLVEGEVVDSDDFIEGFPPHIWEAMDEGYD